MRRPGIPSWSAGARYPGPLSILKKKSKSGLAERKHCGICAKCGNEIFQRDFFHKCAKCKNIYCIKCVLDFELAPGSSVGGNAWLTEYLCPFCNHYKVERVKI